MDPIDGAPDCSAGDGFAAERMGINLYSEHGLHDALKRIAAGPGGRIEVEIGGKIADALRADGEIVEVQTAGLAALRGKIALWTGEGRRVRVIRPLFEQLTILRIDPRSGELLSRRKSPRHESFWVVFDDLIRAPFLVGSDLVTLEALSVEATERRELRPEPVRVGRFFRSYRTADRSLDRVLSSRELRGPGDWLGLIPADLPPPWSSDALGAALGIAAPAARKVLYSLARAGLLRAAGKAGRRLLYAPSTWPPGWRLKTPPRPSARLAP